MTSNDNRPVDAAELRRRAEEIARVYAAQSPDNIETRSPEEIRRMLHELQVHQIELEMQNEELCRAQADLEVSRTRYINLYDFAPVGYCTLSEPGLILETNLTFATLLGVTRSALARQPISRFICKEDQDIYYHHRKLLFETGEPQSCEFRMIKPDGVVFWARLEAAAAQDVDGVPACRVVVSDITAQKRAEEAIQENEERFRNIFEAGPLGMVLVSPEYKFVKANHMFCSIMGYTEEELTSLTFADITHSDSIEQDKMAVAKLFSGDIPVYHAEKKYIRKDKKVIWGSLTCTLVRDKRGKPLHTIAFIADITERKQTEAALRESEEIFNRFMEYSPIFVFFKDENIRALRLSKNYEKMLGKPMEQLLGKNMIDLFPSELANSMVADDTRILKEGKVITVEEEFNGRFYSTIKFPIFINGNPRFLAGYTIDITERREAEEAQRRLEAQLVQAQKMESVGRLAGGIAHDFNNTLAVMMSCAELLKMQYNDPSSIVWKAVTEIMDGIQRAANLTNQLLGFARGGKYWPVSLDMNAVIRDTLQVSEKIFEKRIAVYYDFEEPLPTVEADKNQIYQVLTNLIINAKDAITDSGSLTFKTALARLDDAAVQHFPGMREGVYVMIKITDTGSGMPKEVLDKIFEPFYTTKDVGKGTGLGLAMVYGIIKNHGGYIACESEPGKGTTFTLYLPVSGKDVVEEPIVEQPVGGDATILVVDDEPGIRTSLQSMLEYLGYTVMTAVDGAEAVSVYTERQASIDLVLLDMIMPKMDGVASYRALRKLNPEVKVVLISGFSLDDRATEIMKDGVLGFLPKPFHLNELSEAVSKALAE